MIYIGILSGLVTYLSLRPIPNYPLFKVKYTRRFSLLVGMFFLLGSLFYKQGSWEMIFFYYLVILCLGVSSLYDYYYMEIPMLMVYGLTFIMLLLKIKHLGFLPCLFDSIKAFFMFMFFKALAVFYQKVKKVEALGQGDIEFIFVFSLIFGQMATLYCVLFASWVGIIFSMITKKTKLPFIPFLTLGSIIYYIL